MSRLIIFCNRASLAQDLNDLLEQDLAVDVVGWEKDLEEAIRRIHQIRPEVVIVAIDDEDWQPSREVSRILEEDLQVSVVTMNLPSKTICIYRAHESMADSLEELLEVVQASSVAAENGHVCGE